MRGESRAPITRFDRAIGDSLVRLLVDLAHIYIYTLRNRKQKFSQYETLDRIGDSMFISKCGV